MNGLSILLSLVHLIGLALAVGSASAKLMLLLTCNADPARILEYMRFSRVVTRLIVVGMILLTLSGVAWLVQGYPFSKLLVLKIALVSCIWVLGPVIDNVAEPRLRQLAAASDGHASRPFVTAYRKYLALEVVATSLFYVIIVIALFL